jgi:hypothetical protein
VATANLATSDPLVPLTHAGFFRTLRELGPLRVISRSGASTFEAICEVGEFELAKGFLNAITPAYHWHIQLSRFGHVCSHDATHARSGRRVLFFELREKPDVDPFLSIYLYRGPGEEFGAEREARFARAHERLAAGCDLVREAQA